MEEEKQKEITKDITGTIPFQIVSLQNHIKRLQIHLSRNRSVKRRGNDKDVSAKRALLKKVAKVKRFLRYLEKRDIAEYEKFHKN